MRADLYRQVTLGVSGREQGISASRSRRGGRAAPLSSRVWADLRINTRTDGFNHQPWAAMDQRCGGAQSLTSPPRVTASSAPCGGATLRSGGRIVPARQCSFPNARRDWAGPMHACRLHCSSITQGEIPKLCKHQRYPKLACSDPTKTISLWLAQE